MSDASLADRLLVATPVISEGTFHRTVVLVLTHSDDGAFGVILNRPSTTRADEIIERWGPRAAAPGVLFDGGPVDRRRCFGLAAGEPVDLHLDPREMPDAPDEVRLYMGHSGWAPGQLEDEIGERAWWVVDAEPDDLMTRDPDGLWERVLRRQPGSTAWFANHPEDIRTG